MSAKKPPPNPLLIRIRYSNPLPPPPFPPKLLTVPTDPTRYANYPFLSALENERDIPVATDADDGMPIEFGLEKDGTYGVGKYWEGDRSVVCGDPDNMPQLDPEDLALLDDPRGASNYTGLLPSEANGSGSGHPNTAGLEKRRADVAWLRRTEYFGDASQKAKEATPQRKPLSMKRTREQRQAIINQTFAASQAPISEIKHPNKPHLRPVASYPVLPNPAIWGNTYQLCRFTENPSDQRADPGAVAAVGPDPRLETSIIRPVIINGEPRMVYYLPRDEDEVKDYKRRKVESKSVDELGEDEEEMDEDHRLTVSHVRDYEIKEDLGPAGHLILAIDEGDEAAGRPPAALYTNLARFNILRRRRVRNAEEIRDYGHEDTFFDGYSIILGSQRESNLFQSWKATREVIAAEVGEPGLADGEGEADAEGEEAMDEGGSDGGFE